MKWWWRPLQVTVHFNNAGQIFRACRIQSRIYCVCFRNVYATVVLILEATSLEQAEHTKYPRTLRGYLWELDTKSGSPDSSCSYSKASKAATCQHDAEKQRTEPFACVRPSFLICLNAPGIRLLQNIPAKWFTAAQIINERHCMYK